jgi:hypothetical protein
MRLSPGEYAKLPVFQPGTSLSVSFWYKFEDPANLLQIPAVFTFTQNGLDDNPRDVMYFGKSADLEAVSDAVYFATTAKDKEELSLAKVLPGVWTNGTWIHYALVLYRLHETPLADWGIFKDGVKIGHTRGPFPSQGTLDNNLLGYGIFEKAPAFTGKIDSFNIFPYALTQQQITALYQTSSPGIVSTLVMMHV